MLLYEIVSATGKMTYNEVRTFLKKDSLAMVRYKSITTSSNDSLTLSGDHLVFSRKSHNDEFNSM